MEPMNVTLRRWASEHREAGRSADASKCEFIAKALEDAWRERDGLEAEVKTLLSALGRLP